MSNKQYLGDSVYIEVSDDSQLILTTENGINGISVTNAIYLDSDVMDNLIEYYKKLTGVKVL